MKTLMRRCAAIVLGLTLGLTAWAGLETVTHIQDLNASWPLGSDLASTSDDHIRNIKSALKTDFPNFNGTYTSAAAPVFAIPSDINTGMYGPSADNLAWATGGTQRAVVGSSGNWTFNAASSGKTVGVSGAANDYAIYASASSTSNQSFGLRVEAGTGALDNAVLVKNQANSTNFFAIRGDGQAEFGDGTAALPSKSYLNDPDTGEYRVAADNLGWSTGGTYRGGISTTIFNIRVLLQGADGTAAGPSYSFENDADTGFYRDTSNQIGIALGGSTAGQIAQGSFTGTLTGCTTSPTATITYQRVGNMVMLRIPQSLNAVSNATTLTITGMPAVIQPAANIWVPINGMQDNGVNQDTTTTKLTASFAASSGTITLERAGSSTGWTNSGQKGLFRDVVITYWVGS